MRSYLLTFSGMVLMVQEERLLATYPDKLLWEKITELKSQLPENLDEREAEDSQNVRGLASRIEMLADKEKQEWEKRPKDNRT